jgi:Single Cache domain 2
MADKVMALDQMKKGEGGCKNRDLYTFCASVPDDVRTIPPALQGTKLQSIKDKDGKALGEEMMKVATQDKVGEVSYMCPRPGDTARCKR